MPQCSPSRAAVMTGRYAFHIGMQHFTTLTPGSEAGLPLDTPTLAEVLKTGGYETHGIGKWHLGSSRWAQTPVGRGFDSYLGYLQGQTDYYNHTVPSCGGLVANVCMYPANRGQGGFANSGDGAGLDFWRDKAALTDSFGNYSVPMYTARFDEIVAANVQSKSAKPLFVYFAQQVRIGLHVCLYLCTYACMYVLMYV